MQREKRGVEEAWLTKSNRYFLDKQFLQRINCTSSLSIYGLFKYFFTQLLGFVSGVCSRIICGLYLIYFLSSNISIEIVSLYTRVIQSVMSNSSTKFCQPIFINSLISRECNSSFVFVLKASKIANVAQWSEKGYAIVFRVAIVMQYLCNWLVNQECRAYLNWVNFSLYTCWFTDKLFAKPLGPNVAEKTCFWICSRSPNKTFMIYYYA